MLQATDVVFGYGAAEVLRGVSVDVPRDGFVGILGPNGSGKTTLLRVLAGTIRPSSGRVTLDGVDLTKLPRQHLARRMAVVPQETRLAFDFTVLEVVLMGRYPHLGRFEVEGPGDAVRFVIVTPDEARSAWLDQAAALARGAAALRGDDAWDDLWQSAGR